MQKIIPIAVLLCVTAALPAGAAESKPVRELLGLRLEMARPEAEKRLQALGKLERNERRGQEIWKVRDERFSHVIVAFTAEGEMRFVTAVAREDKEAKRVPYSFVGDVQTARQAGDEAIKNFNYEWNLPPQGKSPATMVIARGRDPKFLTTASLKRVGRD